MTSETVPYHRPMQLPQKDFEMLEERMIDTHATGYFSNGPNCRGLESWFQDYYYVKHAISTCNCTQGLLIALQSMRRQFHLRDCITPAFAWFSSQWALETAGFKIHYEDINYDTWIMQDNGIGLNDQHEFSLPVHTFGNTAQNHSKHVVYDGAHALGSKLPDIGDATVFSLAPTKIITSIEGGMIITDNDLLAANIVALRDKTCRMSEIHAIFGNAYLKHLSEILKWKQSCYQKYKEEYGIELFQEAAYSHNHNTIGMRTGGVIPASVETRKYYTPLVHGLKHTDELYRDIICLPSWYQCPADEVIKRIKEANE